MFLIFQLKIMSWLFTFISFLTYYLLNYVSLLAPPLFYVHLNKIRPVFHTQALSVYVVEFDCHVISALTFQTFASELMVILSK